jgi:hypothetical protein
MMEWPTEYQMWTFPTEEDWMGLDNLPLEAPCRKWAPRSASASR